MIVGYIRGNFLIDALSDWQLEVSGFYGQEILSKSGTSSPRVVEILYKSETVILNKLGTFSVRDFGVAYNIGFSFPF